MAATDICLKWNNHRDALVSLLYSQLESKKMVDVTIAAEGKFLNVHRLLLCASSTYFENLLAHFDKPTVVILQTVKFADIKLLIEYIYKGEVSLSADQLESFLEAAKCLQIKGLVTNKGNNSIAHQEPTLPVEMPITPTPTPDPFRLNNIKEAALAADDLDQTILLETEEDSNQQGGGLDVSQVIHLNPIITNQNESPVEEEQAAGAPEGEMDTTYKENQDHSLTLNSSVDEDLLQSDSEEDEIDKSRGPSTRLRSTKGKDGNVKANFNQTGSEPFKCGACGRGLKTKYLLKRHLQLGKCQSVSYFRCTLCGTSISRKLNVHRHLLSAHKNVEPSRYDDYITEVEPTFTCSVCSYRGKDHASLQRHKKKKHSGKSS